VRFQIFPDGGVSRLRLWGTVTREGASASASTAPTRFPRTTPSASSSRGCGSTAWAKKMAHARPFAGLAAMKERAASIWARSARKTGSRRSARTRASARKTAQRWASQEQANAKTASAETLAALADANRAYEAKFGHIYIVCATGKSADEMLALARARLANEAATELARSPPTSSERITELRLEKMVSG